MPYATPADLILRFDANTIADLASDSGTPEPTIATSQIVLTSLSAASGRVDASIRVGNLYQASDIAAMTGDSMEYLMDLVCELAMARLVARRPERYREQYEELTKHAEESLERLRKGENVFAIEVNVAAGLPTVDGPSTVTYTRLNLLPERTRNFFPYRKTRLPLGR